MKRATRFAMVFSIVFLAVMALTMPGVMKVRGAVSNGDPESEPLLRSSTNLVTIYASVSDNAGRFVGGLKPDDFEIFDNGTRQSIEYFSQEERPLSIGIIFDTSASMKDRIDRATDAMNHFLDQHQQDDEFFLMTFNTTVQMAHDYTRSPQEIIESLKEVAPSGLTSLNDAIFAGVEKVKQGHNAKRALVVISDGQDNSSWYSSKELAKILTEADVQLFTIGITDNSKDTTQGILEREGRELLRHFSEQSGGRAFFPTNMEEFDKVLAKVSIELRNQYSIGFTPSTGLDGSWHRLQVKIKDPLKAIKAKADANPRMAVRSRSGYRAFNR